MFSSPRVLITRRAAVRSIDCVNERGGNSSKNESALVTSHLRGFERKQHSALAGRAAPLATSDQRVSLPCSGAHLQPSDQTTQILALEIDYGPFEREVRLPADVDVKRARAEQENGLLWIYLPLKK
ncbi:MAG: hypothetical protein DME32_07675 [Verrucomicrobia bacterium]|nr:MAG: hypothetical protein DME32_07675 [Verrucomicrobiota bacterium]